MASGGRWMMGLGGGAALCAGMGAVLGQDAAGQVNQFYTSPRLHAERPIPAAEITGLDWNEPRSSPEDIPAGGAVWLDGGGTGSDRSDGSTLIEIDRAVERAAPVRVHRSHPARPVRQEPNEDTPTADDLSDDPVAT